MPPQRAGPPKLSRGPKTEVWVEALPPGTHRGKEGPGGERPGRGGQQVKKNAPRRQDGEADLAKKKKSLNSSLSAKKVTKKALKGEGQGNTGGDKQNTPSRRNHNLTKN